MKEVPHVIVGSRTMMRLVKDKKERQLLARIFKNYLCEKQDYEKASQFRDIENENEPIHQ